MATKPQEARAFLDANPDIEAVQLVITDANGIGRGKNIAREELEPFFRIDQQVPAPLDARPTFREVHEDRLWHWLYLPVARAAEFVTTLVTVLQRGRISVYLTYSFVTLLVLLLFVR